MPPASPAQSCAATCPNAPIAVWWGAAAGIGLSLVFGIIFAVIFYVFKTVLFQGKAKAIFQGVICYTATILITWLGFAMLRFANIEKKWARKLDASRVKVCALQRLDVQCGRSSLRLHRHCSCRVDAELANAECRTSTLSPG